MLEQNTDGRSPYLFTCDHYGRLLPRALGDLGLPASELERHIGWDIGIAGVAEAVSRALDAHLVWLTVLGLLNSAVAAYYYLRVIVVMYMQEPGEATATLQPLGLGIRTALWVSALGTLILGIFPSTLLNFARSASVLIK